MRYVAFTITLFLAMPARAQETTVWFTILARGGTEDVEIGPDGGLVPYRLWMQTDPLGTPGNFGIWGLSVTIETNLGVAQTPLKRELPPRFAGGVGGRLGAPIEDDLAMGAVQRQSGRGGVMQCNRCRPKRSSSRWVRSAHCSPSSHRDRVHGADPSGVGKSA